jgi:hypothetical protein
MYVVRLLNVEFAILCLRIYIPGKVESLAPGGARPLMDRN